MSVDLMPRRAGIGGWRKGPSSMEGLKRRKRRQVRHPGRRTVPSVNNCSACGGAIVKCPVCHHRHCDDDCRPIECEEQRDEDQGLPRSTAHP